MNDDEMARAVNAAVQADMASVARASSRALAGFGPALRGVESTIAATFSADDMRAARDLLYGRFPPAPPPDPPHQYKPGDRVEVVAPGHRHHGRRGEIRARADGAGRYLVLLKWSRDDDPRDRHRSAQDRVPGDALRPLAPDAPVIAAWTDPGGPPLRGSWTSLTIGDGPPIRVRDVRIEMIDDVSAPRPVPPRVAPAYEYVADLTAAAAAALEPPLRAVVHWPDGQRQEWAVPAAERAAVEAALAAAGAEFTIEKGDD